MQIPAGHTFEQSVWRKGVCYEVQAQVLGMAFTGTDDYDVFVTMKELAKQRGATVLYKFAPLDFTHDGFGSTAQKEGNEQEGRVLQDSVTVDYLSEVFRAPDPMSQQRVNFDQKQLAYTNSSAWWRDRFERWVWNHMCGYTPANTAAGAGSPTYSQCGMQAVVAYDSGHELRPGTHTTDVAVGADPTAELTLDLIGQAVTKAATNADGTTWRIAPAPDGYYHLVISPFHRDQLRNNTAAGEWVDITRARIEGGESYDSSGFAQGFLGIWDKVKIHVSEYITPGVNAGATVANCRRAVLLGSRAGVWAWGEGYDDGKHLDFKEQVRDFDIWAVQAASLGGFKRCVFTDSTVPTTNETYGSIVLSTYSRV